MPIGGIWDLTIITPMGPQIGRLRLIVRDQDLSGEISGRGGARTPLDGEVIGSDLFWTVDTATGAIEFSASVFGGTMNGEIQVGKFADITFVGSYVGPGGDL